MQNVSFSARFSRALTLCRYAVYLAMGLLVVLAALQRGERPGLVTAYFFFMPLLLHGLLSLLQRRRAHLLAYLLEWACTLTMVLLCGLPAIAGLAVVVVFAASNTALWGWRMLPGMAAVAGGAIAGLQIAGLNLPVYSDALIDGLAAGGAIAFVLALCSVAHAQANQLVRAGSTLRLEKQLLLRYLPKDLSQHLRAPGEGGVRRLWLTVAFVDLVGFTRAANELPAEALVTLLNDFLGVVNTLVEQWDGSISKFLGDGVLCVFPSNAPPARANAAVQAVRGLAQLPDILRGLNGRWRALGYRQEFAVTVGIASGECCIGDWGGSTRLDYTVIGVPVNLACRLQAEAGPRGGVLLDEATAALVGGAIGVQEAVAVDIKGMGTLQVYPLQGGTPDVTVGCQRLLC